MSGIPVFASPDIHNVSIGYETYTCKGYNTTTRAITVGSNISIGTITLMVDYKWNETWRVNSYGNRLEEVTSTTPVITSGDYYLNSLGSISQLSETLASNGSTYSVRLSIQYTEPHSNISYTKIQTFTVYASSLSKN